MTAKDIKDAKNSIKYIQDEKTGVCFALLPSYVAGGWCIVNFAVVPYEAVKDHLEK